VVHRDANASLELTSVLEVGVEPRAIAGTEVFLEQAQLAGDRIENARILLPAGKPLLRTRAVAEQALEDHSRIDFRRERLRRRRPRDGVGVRAAVAPVAVAEIAGVFHAKLE